MKDITLSKHKQGILVTPKTEKGKKFLTEKFPTEILKGMNNFTIDAGDVNVKNFFTLCITHGLSVKTNDGIKIVL